MKRIVMIIMAVALIALPTVAQDWQSTSSMQTSGSAYSSQVTAVGATGVDDMATTTESYSPAKAPSGPRRIDTAPGQDGGYADDGSPIGDVWPLAFFALIMAIVIGIKRNVNPKIEKQ